MINYPKNFWTDEDIEKMKREYFHSGEAHCPIDGERVVIKKEEGEEYLKKRYVKTHFFLVYKCPKCGRRDTRTYRSGPSLDS